MALLRFALFAVRGFGEKVTELLPALYKRQTCLKTKLAFPVDSDVAHVTPFARCESLHLGSGTPAEHLASRTLASRS